MLLFASIPSASVSPTPQQIADLRLAASQMTGATRPSENESVMSGKVEILPSEVEPQTSVCGTLFSTL